MTKKVPMKKYPWEVPTKSELKEILIEDPIESVKIKVTAELMEPMLGTVPKNKKIFTDFVSEKMGEFQGKPLKTMDQLEEEIDSAPEDLEKTATGFHKDTFGIFLYNYMIIGNIKANLFCLMSNGVGKVLNYKKSSDLFLSVSPRKIRFFRENEDCPLMQSDGSLERSLRAQTPRGDRTFLAKSDFVEAKTRFKFVVEVFRNDRGLTPEMIVHALKFGKNNGLGQWRGSGSYGKFKLISLRYV